MISLRRSKLAGTMPAGFKTCVVAIVVALLLTGAPAAFAQSIFANLSGTVTDSNGDVVPGATVDVENVATKVIRHYVCNGSGFFSATELPSGTYNVTAEARGFQRWVGSGIVLNSSDDKTLSIPLKVGVESVTVEVRADLSEIAITDTGEKIVRIDSNQLDNLSLVGRNAFEVLKILPGAAQISNGGTNRPGYSGEMIGINGSVGGAVGGLSGVSLNGQTGMGVSLNQDGQNVEDPGNPGSATPVNPNPDMIGEMTVQTSNYGADNVKGPVVINTISKQGSANFHGDVRFNARNSDLNAEEAYSKYNESNPANGFSPGQLKIPSHNYYPGFSIGGPILIPHTGFNKSRTKFQFFESFEYYDQLIAALNLDRAFVPTADMLNGDFSAMAGWQNAPGRSGSFGIPTAPAPGSKAGFDLRAAQGCTITGGVLSSQCISPMGQQLLKLAVPAATAAQPNSFGFNYINGMSAHQNSFQNVAHVDLNLSDNTKAYLSWSHQSESAEQPDGLWGNTGDWDVPVPGGEVSKNRSDLYTGNLLHLFSPTLTVEARFGYTHMDMPGAPQRPNQVLRSGLNFPQKGVFGSPMAPRITNGWDGGGIPNLGDWFAYYHPTYYAEKYIPSTGADVTKVVKTHTLKAGFFWEHLSNAQDANGMQYGGEYNYPSWAGNTTGNQYADILMGLIDYQYYEQAFAPTYATVESIYSSYVTDHWKISRRITVDFGTRFDHYTAAQPNDPWGNAVWLPKQYQAGVPNSGVSWHSLNSSISKAGVSVDPVKFSPRFGASIDVFGTGKTVVRGGWGIYLAQNPVLSQGGPAGVPEGSVTWSCGGSPDCLVWEQVDNHIPNGSGGCAANTNCAPTVTASSFTGHPNLNNSSFNVVDSTNKDNPETITYSLNIDQQLPKKFQLEASYVGNHSNYIQNGINLNSVPLGAMSDSATVMAVPACAAHGTYSSAIGQADCQQQFRPFTNYQGVNVQESSKKSQYDALQISLRRSAGWATVSLNYSFAKAFTNTNSSGGFKDYGVREYWSVDPNDRAHVFNAAYYFTVPKSSSSNRLVRTLSSGWEISGITQVQSGAQLVTASSSNFNLSGGQGAVALVGTPDVSVAPVLVCDPRHGFRPGQFLNPNCFTLPSGTNYGDGRNPYMAGPMYWNSDASLIKRFNIKEKQNLEVRFSAFNFLNHALNSFNNGDNNLKLNFNSSGVLTNGNGTSTAPCPGPYCQEFGYADYHYGHRELEFGVKYSF
jgi:hypothetical protein